jgi:hypothetical protein
MPKALHDKLERQAKQQGLKGDRKDAYVYGTMNKIEQRREAKLLGGGSRRRLLGGKS